MILFTPNLLSGICPVKSTHFLLPLPCNPEVVKPNLFLTASTVNPPCPLFACGSYAFTVILLISLPLDDSAKKRILFPTG